VFEGELSTPRDVQAGVTQDFFLFPSLYTVCINDTALTPGVYLTLFTDDRCIYITDRQDGYVLRKLERNLTLMESWGERWNIKINEDNIQTIYFPH
jgi:hypothetical protein